MQLQFFLNRRASSLLLLDLRQEVNLSHFLHYPACPGSRSPGQPNGNHESCGGTHLFASCGSMLEGKIEQSVLASHRGLNNFQGFPILWQERKGEKFPISRNRYFHSQKGSNQISGFPVQQCFVKAAWMDMLNNEQFLIKDNTVFQIKFLYKCRISGEVTSYHTLPLSTQYI